MRRSSYRLAALAAGAATLITVAAATPAAAHNSEHVVSIAGLMDIETGGPGPHRLYPFDGKVVVGPRDPIGKFHASACEAGVRTDFDLVAQDGISDPLPGGVLTNVKVSIFVGATCETAELKASKSAVYVIPANQSRADAITVLTADLRAPRATVRFKLHNETRVPVPHA